MATTVPNFRVKKMTDDCVAIAYDLHVAAHQDDALDWGQFHGLVVSRDVFGLMSWADSEPVGYMLYRQDVEFQTVEVLWFGVDKCFRRLGIANKLFERLKLLVIMHAIYKRITCWVDESNYSAQTMLAGHEFQAVRLIPIASNWSQVQYVFRRDQKKLDRKSRFKVV